MTSAKNPKIFVYDDLHPEDCAMLQALYSRSPASVEDHLTKVQGTGSGNFMSKFYVGYGHASIGDCGSTTLFIENYSMLAAKAIQDNPLYSGQEASTRYLDFSVQPLIDPYEHPASMAILQGWMTMYNTWLPKIKTALAELHPFDETQYRSEKVWQNTIEARAFDTCRGLLPVGTSTLLSWSTNLRQARDRLMQLKTHPLAEVRALAQDVFQQLHAKYPNSFNGSEMTEGAERYHDRDDYNREFWSGEHYHSLTEIVERFGLDKDEEMAIHQGNIVVKTNALDVHQLNMVERQALAARPENGTLPRRLQAYGHYNLAFKLDFGSYRDLQRHRGGYGPMPLIDDTLGFHDWYLEEFKDLLGTEYHTFKAEMDQLLDQIQALPQQGVTTDVYRNQYLYPMGMAVPVSLSYSVPQLTYVAELRASKTVHPSLRPIAQQMARILAQHHPGMALYADMDADSWSAKRGEQTIMEKKSA